MSTENALVTTQPNGLAAIVQLVTNAVTSEHTKRAYRRTVCT